MKKTQKTSSIKYIVNLVKPYWYLIFLSIIFSTFASLLSGAIAWLVKPFLDKIFLPQNYKYLIYLPFIVAGIFVLRASAVFLQAYFIKKASYSVGKNLRIDIYKKVVHIPLHSVIQKSVGEMISRVINDVNVLELIIGDVFKTFFLEGITVIILIGVAFYRSWKLTLLTFAILPILVFTSEWLAKKTHKNRHLMQKKLGELTHILYETLNSLKEIKVYLLEKKMIRQFSLLCEDTLRVFLKLVKYEEGTKFVVNILTGLAAAIIIFYGGYLIKSHSITPGDFFSLFTAILMIFNPLKKLAGAYNKLHNAIASIDRIKEILAISEEKGGNKKLKEINIGIKFINVSFKYPGAEEWALKDINFSIPAGKTIAIIGKSGSGKSTLVSLIPRFYDPTIGKITIDGIDLKEIDLKSLRSLIGIVSQEVIVFNMSIAENIALGKPDATREEIIKAAKLAYAHDFISELPNGYDTILGKEGFTLSGGQKQRIAIARAILKNPPILILDEATSHLDNISEKYIQKALENLMKNKTTIIIAHRLSTVKSADIVVVLKNGKIVCQGSHEQLKISCPEYKKLYQLI